MSISPRDVWPSLFADRRSVILDDLAALLREISHDLGAHHATAPVPQGRDLHSPVHAASGAHQPGEPGLQYALRQRACDLGWNDADVAVIDADLGQSGAATEHRRGFKDLIARVTLGEIGLILSYEVTRLARNCSDWYPLLDLRASHNCGTKCHVPAFEEGVETAETPGDGFRAGWLVAA